MRTASILVGLILVALLSSKTEAQAQTSGLISVSQSPYGWHIEKDNQAWVPKSITINGAKHVDALTPAIMSFYGADAIRIFVDQDFVDPEYVIPPDAMKWGLTPEIVIPQLLNAVYTLRQQNVPVIIVITSFAQGNQNSSNWPPPCTGGANLPTDAHWVSYPTTGPNAGKDCGASTSRAWQALINPPATINNIPLQNMPNYSIKNDMGVMFEIYNEPTSASDNDGHFGKCFHDLTNIANIPACEKEADWAAWQSSHQVVINNIRNAYGAKNVVVVDGLDWAHLFNDSENYLPSDSFSSSNPQIIYAEHPYLNANFDNPALWDQFFGNFAAEHPFLITEFNVMPTKACLPEKPAVTSRLLAYLDKRHIGMNLWAYDQPQTLFVNGTPGAPPPTVPNQLSVWWTALAQNLTTFNGDTASCDQSDTSNGGWMIYNYYQRDSLAAPTNLQIKSSGDGFSVTAFWQNGGSKPLNYIAAILPQGHPLYSPSEGAFPPLGTTDAKEVTSLQFNNLAPGTYMVEVWSYDPSQEVTVAGNGTVNRLYSPPAVQYVTVNGSAHLQILDRDFPFITDDIARIAAPYPTPDGEKDGELLIENDANNQHGMFQNLTEGAANVTHTFSVAVKAYAPVLAESRHESNEYVKGKPRDLSLVAFSNRLNANMQAAVCDPSTGTLQLQYPTPQTPTPMVYLGSGFYLCTVIFTQEPEGTQVWIKLNNPDFMQDNGENQSRWSYTGDGISGLEIWNPQLFKIAQ